MTIAFMGCFFNTKTSTSEETQPFSGEFLYLADAAVFNTGHEVYGVTIDKKMHELHDKIKPFKKDEYDMIPVFVKGYLTPNTQNEGWPQVLTIVSIDSIAPSKTVTNSIIQLSSE
jgi:hypothetical protein